MQRGECRAEDIDEIASESESSCYQSASQDRALAEKARMAVESARAAIAKATGEKT